MKLKSHLWMAAILSLVLAGGLKSSEAQDTNQPKWTSTGSLFTARVDYTATLLPNGCVLIAGGYKGSVELADSELYEPDRGVFVHTGNLSSARTSHTATLLPNGKVLVVGGQLNGNTLTSAELYNPASGVWEPTGNLNFPRSYHTATLLKNGQVLVTGGSYLASPPVFSQGAPPGSAMDISELYDPATGKWTVTGSLFAARYMHTATLLRNGQVLVTGGLNADGAGDALAHAELYDPKTGTWTGTNNPPTSRFGHTATLLPNGQVLVVGGQYKENLLASAELYDPSNGTWIAAGSLHATHSGHTATLLSNGQVLVAGGNSDSGASTNAELYNSSNDAWQVTASLNTAHALHTATLLSHGQVLVTGGLYAVGSPAFVSASAELYGRSTKSHPSETQNPSDDNPSPAPPPSNPPPHADTFD